MWKAAAAARVAAGDAKTLGLSEDYQARLPFRVGPYVMGTTVNLLDSTRDEG